MNWRTDGLAGGVTNSDDGLDYLAAIGRRGRRQKDMAACPLLAVVPGAGPECWRVGAMPTPGDSIDRVPSALA